MFRYGDTDQHNGIVLPDIGVQILCHSQRSSHHGAEDSLKHYICRLMCGWLKLRWIHGWAYFSGQEGARARVCVCVCVCVCKGGLVVM
jgi:hypothetical protein